MSQTSTSPHIGENEPHPYTMRLANGHTLVVKVPAHMLDQDRDGQVALTPQGIKFLDRLRALAMPVPEQPSPAYLVTVRQALDWSESEMAQRLGCTQSLINQWEQGVTKPGQEAVQNLRRVINRITERGVVLPDA